MPDEEHIENSLKISPIPLSLPMTVTQKNGYPCVMLRRTITETELLKIIVACALFEVPIQVIPTFQDRARSVASMVEKGILYYKNEEKEFFFNI